MFSGVVLVFVDPCFEASYGLCCCLVGVVDVSLSGSAAGLFDGLELVALGRVDLFASFALGHGLPPTCLWFLKVAQRPGAGGLRTLPGIKPEAALGDGGIVAVSDDGGQASLRHFSRR